MHHTVLSRESLRYRVVFKTVGDGKLGELAIIRADDIEARYFVITQLRQTRRDGTADQPAGTCNENLHVTSQSCFRGPVLMTLHITVVLLQIIMIKSPIPNAPRPLIPHRHPQRYPAASKCI